MRTDVKIPVKITPCPIVDAIFEIRFESKLPDEAVFGFLYSKISSKCASWQVLPATNIPKELRLQDPNIKFAAHYQCKVGNFVYKIGPNVLAVTNPGTYTGWTSFFGEVTWFIQNFLPKELINSIPRLGFRCVNYFESNIFDLIEGSTGIDFSGFTLLENSHVLVIKKGIHHARVALMNNAVVQIESLVKRGGLFDLDISIYEKIEYDDILQLTEKSHNLLKQIFFGTLKQHVIDSMNPEYLP